MALRKVWEAFRGVDRRALQFEIDMHRLFLLTSYHKRGDGGLDEVTESGFKASMEDLQKAVHENVHEQIVRITEALDDILLAASRKKLPLTEVEVKRRPSGLSFAVGREAPKVEDPETLIPLETRSLSFAEVSSSLRKMIGYTLSLMPSQIDHKEAGQGVHLKGKVKPGTVVSFYPGIIYTPSQYRYMRGYPRMDVANSYLVSRYDGLIIDGQFWGQGGESRVPWNGNPSEDVSERIEPVKKMNLWSSVFGAKNTHYARKASIIERRNPLALAHYINHPAKGNRPNVMLCPYDFVLSDPYMRPYIPNVHFDHSDDHEMKRQGLVWTYNRKGEKACTGSGVIRTLVLVSTSEIQDEELFLNYRLSNHKKWPSWYHPVDSEEDKRRWH